MSTVSEPVVAPGRGFWVALRGATPLLVSTGLLLVGNGLVETLLGVRAAVEGFSPGVIGLVLAGYYVGYVGGSYFAPPAIIRVGHVRVFAALAGLASAAVLLHLEFVDPVSWFVLRVVVGWCVSALYVVCETWLNGVTTNRSRGSLFAVYMIVVSGAMLGGQGAYAALGPYGFEPFLIAAVLFSVAVVPVSLAVFPSPTAPRPVPVPVRTIVRIAPLTVIGTAMSGFIGAAVMGAGVVFAHQAGFDRGATGAFIGAALAGGVVLQLPLGAWSDRVDRRLVLALTAGVGAVVAVVASSVPTDRRLVLIGLTAIAGGAAFPVYSLAVAHLNDYIADDLKVAVGSKLILVNGIGAIAGPIVGSVAIGVWSPESLFLVLAVGYVVVLAGTLYRITKRSESEEAVRARFVPVAVGVGPVGVGVGDHGEGEFAELVRGVVTFATAEVHYVECGSGPSIVLIGDATGPAGDVADGLIGPLVADGFHVVMPLLGSGHVPDDAVGAVLEVLRAVSVPAATFVGVDSGVDVIRRVAEHRADRTHALVAIADVRPPDADGTHGDDAHPMLWLPRRALVESPEDAADDIAEFVRPIVAAMSVQWETGRFDVIDPERPDATSTT